MLSKGNFSWIITSCIFCKQNNLNSCKMTIKHCVKYVRIRNLRFYPYKGKYGSDKPRIVVYFTQGKQSIRFHVGGEGATCQNLNRDALLGLKLGQIQFFCVGKFLSYFEGLTKFLLFFWVWQISSCFFGLPIFVLYT